MTQKALLQSAGDGTAVPAGYVGEIITAGSLTSYSSLSPNNSASLVSQIIQPGIYIVNLYLGMKPTLQVTRGLAVSLSESTSLPNGYQNAITTGPVNVNGDSSIPQGFCVSTYVRKSTASTITFFVDSYASNPSVSISQRMEIIRIA